MDLEKGKYKCYICLNNVNKIYLSCNTCKDGKICRACSHGLIYNYHSDKKLLNCGICRKEFELSIKNHSIIYNIKNIDTVKKLYIIFCVIYTFYDFFRFNFINFSYNNLYCNIKPVINSIYNGTNVFVLSLMIIEKFIFWSLILRHRLLIRSSISKILCVYLFYENFGCITYSFLFYNIFYKCQYNNNFANYCYVVLWCKLFYSYIFINIYCR